MAVSMETRELPFCGTLAPVYEEKVTRAVMDLFPDVECVHHVRELEGTWPLLKMVFRERYSKLSSSFGTFRKKCLSLRIDSSILDTWPYLRRFSEFSSVMSAVHEIQYEYELFLQLGNFTVAEKIQLLRDHCAECVPLGRRITDQQSIVVLWF